MSIDQSLFDEALAKGQLMQYLGGFPGYYIQPLAADLPTEYYYAFTPIKNRLKIAPDFGEEVVNAIAALAQDSEYGWGAIFHISNLAMVKRYQGIDLLSPQLLASVADDLRRNKDSFKSLKKWVGKDNNEGVWEMVRVINRNLHTDNNITVLPEEL